MIGQAVLEEKILSIVDERTDGQPFERDGIYVATFSVFGYLCGYLPMCGLDTQGSILATKVSNLRNKSHLYSKMTTCVSNCPNFIATGVPIGLYVWTVDHEYPICSPFYEFLAFLAHLSFHR